MRGAGTCESLLHGTGGRGRPGRRRAEREGKGPSAGSPQRSPLCGRQAPIGLTSSPPAGRTLPPPLQLDVVRSLVTRFWLVTHERGQDIALLRTSFRGRGAFLVPLASHSASQTVNVMPGAVAAWGVDATLGRGAGQSSDPRRRPDGRLWTTAKWQRNEPVFCLSQVILWFSFCFFLAL